MAAPSPGYSITVRVEAPTDPAATARLSSVVAEAGGAITALDVAESHPNMLVVDVSCNASDVAHSESITKAIAALDGFSVRKVSDRTFLLHLGGKIEVTPKVPLKHRDDLSRAYTPGVARVCLAIAENPADARRLTIKRNTVAVVTDGSAVLGLGNIGPAAALPVMEGKAALFKRFADVDAWPVCLDTKDTEEIIRIVKVISPGYGGVNLEDIAAPRCFEIERRLRDELDIPVFHDDQHGTAIVVLAALLSSLRIVGKRVEDITVVVVGAGAAGVACTEIMLAQGVGDVIVCDRHGALVEGDPGLDVSHAALAARTNREHRRGMANDLLAGADVLLGVSGPGAVSPEAVRTMARDAIVFAMANPIPEVQPEAVRDDVAIMATGRSDYPNQINNVLAFPGVFRGALDVRAREINEEMKVAAAHAIAQTIADAELSADYVVPSVFNRAVAPAVAAAVAQAADETGVARRHHAPASA